PALRDSLGVQTSTLWTDNQPNTVFARKMLEPGRLQVFSTILIPHEENETNRDIAAAIEWHEQPDSPTYADVTLRGRKTTLMVSPEGKWSVKRVNIPKPVPPVTAPSAVPAATPSAPVTVPPTSGGK
ncbi:MAG TPA: hypothetical protein VKC60_04825, partial [Opitutaceae bacterium]|nr:hypothetical protein [Opitutaceae bacterium]